MLASCTYVKARGTTTRIVSGSNIVETMRGESTDAIDQGVEEPQGGLSIRDAGLVQKGDDTCECGCSSRGSTD